MPTHTVVRITAGFVCMFGPEDGRYPSGTEPLSSLQEL